MSQENETKSTEITPEISEAMKTLHSLIHFIKEVVFIILLALMLRFFVMTPFQIQGTSMINSYSDNEYIGVNIGSYLDFNSHFSDFAEKNKDNFLGAIGNFLRKIPIHIGDPKRGDVVVLKPHVDKAQEHYLKRVIGLPGEEIRIGSGHVFIKPVGKKDFIQIQEPYLSVTNAGQTLINDSFETRSFSIPEGHYWVMGDNRKNSSDSRDCFRSCSIPGSTHFLARKDVVGKVAISFGYFNLFEEKKFPKFGSLSWEVQPRFFSTPKDANYPELESNIHE